MCVKLFFSAVTFNLTRDFAQILPCARSKHNNMASSGSGDDSRTPDLKRPASFKADIWNYFGFRLRNDKDKELDKSKAVCKTCQMEVKYSGNKTNLRNHMQRHHEDIMSEPTGPQQKKLKESLQLQWKPLIANYHLNAICIVFQ